MASIGATCYRSSPSVSSVFRVLFFTTRNFSLSNYIQNVKRPRVLPVTHQVLADHNAQYFTPYPQCTKEELEEPPPKVCEEVRELLVQRRASWNGTQWVSPKIKAWQYRKKRRDFIAAGYYFPVFPMRDRYLDPMPKVRLHILKKEKRLTDIEENMKMMPQWIAEYKEKIRTKKLNALKAKEDSKFAMMQIKELGLHPKDPRAKQLLGKTINKENQGRVKKPKFGRKKKNT